MSIWTHEIDAHLVPTDERTQLVKHEQQILHEYNELKAEIEDNDVRYNLTYTRPFSSYLIPKDPAHLARERRLYLERLARVPTIPDVALIDEEFHDELQTCSPNTSDFTCESLPLLLQAFYIKRLSSLTYAKTLHSVRWKRFNRQQTHLTQVEQQYQERSSRILAEFNDALQRSQRLSALRESLLAPISSSSKNINQVRTNKQLTSQILTMEHFVNVI
jgi:type I restriction-modification system DNA methylase subunit